MADGRENREEAQRKTESRSMKGLDLNLKPPESSDDDQSDHIHETESMSSEKKGLDTNLKPSELSKDQSDHRHQTESRSSEKELEECEIRDQSGAEMQSRNQETEPIVLQLKKRGRAVDLEVSDQIRDRKASDAENLQPRKLRDVETKKRRRHETDSRDTTRYDWGERESQRICEDIANRRRETERRSRTNRWDTFPDWRPRESGSESGYPYGPGEEDCQYYLRTGRCSFGEACHFNHPTRFPSVCKFFKSGFCKLGSDCKFVHPEDRDWRYDERTRYESESRFIPETRGITISDSREREPRRRFAEKTREKRHENIEWQRRGTQENVEKQRKFCKKGSDCKFVQPGDTDWRYDERTRYEAEPRFVPETRGITISEARERDPRRRFVENTQEERHESTERQRRGAQENEQEMRERNTPSSRDRDSRKRSGDVCGGLEYNQFIDQIVAGIKRAKKENRSILSPENPAERIERREAEEREERQRLEEKGDNKEQYDR